MLLSLCFLLLALSPSSQEICSAPGTHPAPVFYLNQTSAQPGDSVLLKCSVFSQLPATRIVFCCDGEEVSSQRSLKGKITYNYVRAVSGGSAGNYSCGYEIKESRNRVNRSQLSPAQHLSVVDRRHPLPFRVAGLTMSPIIWATRCILVLLLLVSAPVITFVLEKQGLPEPPGLEKILGRTSGL